MTQTTTHEGASLPAIFMRLLLLSLAFGMIAIVYVAERNFARDARTLLDQVMENRAAHITEKPDAPWQMRVTQVDSSVCLALTDPTYFILVRSAPVPKEISVRIENHECATGWPNTLLFSDASARNLPVAPP
jgi:hypothetical protein